MLTPGRYVGAGEPRRTMTANRSQEKYPRLLAKLEESFAEGERLTAVVRDCLARIKSPGADKERWLCGADWQTLTIREIFARK